MTTTLRTSSSVTVLVVDDHEDTRELYSVALQRFGFRVRTAATGTAAIDEMRREPAPSLMLLDLRLPDLPGRYVFRALRDDDRLRHVPVIAISADPREMGLALQDGFAGFCAKPCPPEHVVHAVVSILMPRVTAPPVEPEPADKAVTVMLAPSGLWWEVRVNGELVTSWPSEFAARAAARQHLAT